MPDPVTPAPGVIPGMDTPCERAAALRARRDEIMLGGAAVETEFEAGNGTRRKVKLQAANLPYLDRAIAEADAACAALGGRPARRFAIVPR